MAAGRIKGITVEIGGDTTKLQTALKGVNSEIKNTQAQLKDVEKLLKLDPGNTDLLAQKQKLLSDAVSETKDKLTTLKTAAEQANTALANGDISQEQYDALQREIIETEQDLKKLEEQAKQSDAALQKIAANGEKLKTVGDNISSAGQKMLPVTAAVTGLGTAAVTTAANFESSMSQVQATMGVTKDAMSTVDAVKVFKLPDVVCTHPAVLSCCGIAIHTALIVTTKQSVYVELDKIPRFITLRNQCPCHGSLPARTPIRCPSHQRKLPILLQAWSGRDIPCTLSVSP